MHNRSTKREWDEYILENVKEKEHRFFESTNQSVLALWHCLAVTQV
jgi:hypothetical protein